MRFERTELDGLVIVDLEPIRDERGFFSRAWCPDEFREAGLDVTWAQENVAYNVRRGTLRGMHFQRDPHAEVKLVRCTRGTVWDVAVDIRPDSPTYLRWIGVELSMENRRSLYIPEGFAHGYLTLTDDVEMRYLTSEMYARHAAFGIRHDEPALGITWPDEVVVMSDADRRWPLLGDAESAGPAAAAGR